MTIQKIVNVWQHHKDEWYNFYQTDDSQFIHDKIYGYILVNLRTNFIYIYDKRSENVYKTGDAVTSVELYNLLICYNLVDMCLSFCASFPNGASQTKEVFNALNTVVQPIHLDSEGSGLTDIALNAEIFTTSKRLEYREDDTIKEYLYLDSPNYSINVKRVYGKANTSGHIHIRGNTSFSNGSLIVSIMLGDNTSVAHHQERLDKALNSAEFMGIIDIAKYMFPEITNCLNEDLMNE